MKRVLSVLLAVLVVLTSINVSVIAQENKIDVEANLNVKDKKMLSGEKNHLDIGFKITGPKTIIENVNLELIYDSKVTIDEEYLKNNIPSEFTYKINTNKVELNIKSMEAGKFYEIPIIFSVENGVIKNNSLIDFTLRSADNKVSLDMKETVEINASSPLKVNKDYVGLAEKGLENTLGIAPGLKGKWKTKAQISKSNYGQMFIKEGTKVKITEKYNSEIFDYIKTENNFEPTHVEEGTLIWEYDAPSYEEQRTSEMLFFKDFDVIYKVKESLKIDTKLDDQGSEVALEFININNELLSDSDEGKTTLYPSAEDTPEVEGNWWIPGHFGPTNAFGDYSTDFEAMNTRPTVYEWATLSYAHQIAALDYGETSVYESYEISYFINDHLILNEIKTPGRFLYRPNNEHGDATYLEEQPSFDVYFYDKDNNLLNIFKDVSENKIIKRSEILKGKEDSIHIKKVVYSATKFVPGMIVDNPEINEKTGFSDLPTYKFSISPTWKNDAKDNMYELKNEKIIEVERKSPENYKETYDFRDGVDYDYIIDSPNHQDKSFEGWHFLSAPRWAVVTEQEEAYIPTVTNTIELMNHKDGIIYPGSNTLKLRLNNDAVSVGAVLPNVESYFILPKSISLSSANLPENLIITKMSLNNYNNLYKLNWNNNLFVPNQNLELELDVVVGKDLNSINLFHYTHLSENEMFHVPKVEEPVLQDSLKMNRPSLLESYLMKKDVVLTRNNYTVLSDYYIKTEKFVKTERDDTFKKTTVMNAEDIVTYKLQFENKKGINVDTFGLIDVLPHVGDLGITNLVDRGSEFDLTLNGPVKVDERFEVVYSKSKNPSREILNEMVDRTGYLKVEGGENVSWLSENEVNDWNEIFSFAVILKDGEIIEIDEKYELEFETKIPVGVKVRNNIYAHNSFAITANGSPLVEPLQVSVKLEGEEEPYTPPTPEKPQVPPTPEKPKVPNTPVTGLGNTEIYLTVLLSVSLSILVAMMFKRKKNVNK